MEILGYDVGIFSHSIITTNLALSVYCSIKGLRQANPIDREQTANEISRRKLCLCLYLLRKPVFDVYTNPSVEKVGYREVFDYVKTFALTSFLYISNYRLVL